MKKKMLILGGIVAMALVVMCVVIYSDKQVSASVTNTSNVDDMSVEDATELLKSRGYNNKDLVYAELFEEIEDMKDDNISEEKILDEMDKKAEDENKGCYRGNPLDEANKLYSMWDGLTADEKKLAISYPAKALIAVVIVKKATNYTIQEFGHNGLGDSSDGFRHATWCALMSRDAGAKFALDFSTAHESGKTEEELQSIAPDGHKEYEHREMDLHNNAIGTKFGKDSKSDDSEIINIVKANMTNDKNTGIYWLHD